MTKFYLAGVATENQDFHISFPRRIVRYDLVKRISFLHLSISELIVDSGFKEDISPEELWKVQKEFTGPYIAPDVIHNPEKTAERTVDYVNMLNYTDHEIRAVLQPFSPNVPGWTDGYRTTFEDIIYRFPHRITHWAIGGIKNLDKEQRKKALHFCAWIFKEAGIDFGKVHVFGVGDSKEIVDLILELGFGSSDSNSPLKSARDGAIISPTNLSRRKVDVPRGEDSSEYITRLANLNSWAIQAYYDHGAKWRNGQTTLEGT